MGSCLSSKNLPTVPEVPKVSTPAVATIDDVPPANPAKVLDESINEQMDAVVPETAATTPTLDVDSLLPNVPADSLEESLQVDGLASAAVDLENAVKLHMDQDLGDLTGAYMNGADGLDEEEVDYFEVDRVHNFDHSNDPVIFETVPMQKKGMCGKCC